MSDYKLYRDRNHQMVLKVLACVDETGETWFVPTNPTAEGKFDDIAKGDLMLFLNDLTDPIDHEYSVSVKSYNMDFLESWFVEVTE